MKEKHRRTFNSWTDEMGWKTAFNVFSFHFWSIDASTQGPCEGDRKCFQGNKRRLVHYSKTREESYRRVVHDSWGKAARRTDAAVWLSNRGICLYYNVTLMYLSVSHYYHSPSWVRLHERWFRLWSLYITKAVGSRRRNWQRTCGSTRIPESISWDQILSVRVTWSIAISATRQNTSSSHVNAPSQRIWIFLIIIQCFTSIDNGFSSALWSPTRHH